MTAQGLEVIDHSVHQTHEWINELAARLGWSSKRGTLRLMRVTLRRLRDHLLVDEAAQFSAQLPVMVRGFFYEGWVPKLTPIRERHCQDFISFVGNAMEGTSEYRGRDDVKCVFDLLNARISRGEVEDVRANLPQDLRDLWPAP